MKVSTIKFSFIVPVYNVEKYLSRCLDSLLTQNYQNFEIICINDGSPDNSINILQMYQKKHNNIFIINQENKGLGGARNTGLKYASGDYIWFIDSDDWIEPTSLYLLNNYISQEGSKDMILFNAYRTKQKGLEGKLIRASNKTKFENGIDYARSLLDGNGLLFSWIKICKRDLFVKSGFQFQKGFFEDISEIPFYANNIHTIGYLEEPLYNYFVNDKSIMHTYDRRIFDAFFQLANLKKSLKNVNELSNDLSYFEIRVTYNTYRKLKYAKDNLRKEYIYQIKQLNLCNIKNISFVLNTRISIKKRIKMFIFIIVHNLKSLLTK